MSTFFRNVQNAAFDDISGSFGQSHDSLSIFWDAAFLNEYSLGENLLSQIVLSHLAEVLPDLRDCDIL